MWNKKAKLARIEEMPTIATSTMLSSATKPSRMWCGISRKRLYYGRVTDDFLLERIDRCRELDNYNRLVTVHDYGFCVRNSEKVDFISRQDWKQLVNSEMLTATINLRTNPYSILSMAAMKRATTSYFVVTTSTPRPAYVAAMRSLCWSLHHLLLAGLLNGLLLTTIHFRALILPSLSTTSI